MEDVSLSLEQLFHLRQLEDELKDRSRDELLRLFLAERALLLLERQWFTTLLDQCGICVGTMEPSPLFPETEEELVEVFGRVPSDEELAAYMNGCLEAARMDDIDIEAIALGED